MNKEELFESIPATVACIDQNGMIVAVNRAWREFAQRGGGPSSLAQGIGVNYLDVCDHVHGQFEEYAKAAAQGIRQVLNREVAIFEMEYPCHTAVEQHWDILRAVPVDEESNHALIMYFTITTTKLADEEAKHQQKLASLGLMAGGIAHDVNNLMLTAMVQLAASQYQLPTDHPAQKQLQQAETALQRTAALAKHLLAYHGAATSIKEVVAVNAFIEDHLAILQTIAFDKNVEIAANLNSEELSVLANRDELFQVLLNLVINAAEAAPPDRQGEILIQTEYQHVLPAKPLVDTYTQGQLAPGPHLCLIIKDNHGGMPASILRSIFDPFFTTKPGTRGLGLSIVMSIVRDHGGIIQVTSKTNWGTTFRIYLPLAESNPAVLAQIEKEASSDAEPHGESRATEIKRQTILVIDDDQAILNAICNLLQAFEYEPIPISNSKVLQEQLNHLTSPPDYAILDINMPNEDTREFFNRLREAYPELKVILSSGFNNHRGALAIIANEQNVTFLSKPYSIEKLIDMLDAFS